MCSWLENAICRECLKRESRKSFYLPLYSQAKRHIPSVNTSVNTSWTHPFDRSRGAWTHFWTHSSRVISDGFFHQFLSIRLKSAIRDEHACCIIQYALVSHQFLTTCSESTWNSRQFLKNLKKLRFFSIFDKQPITIFDMPGVTRHPGTISRNVATS